MAPLTLALALLAAGPRFIEDDYPRALAQAKEQKKLLFVDAWAPWCHTCVYMREHVMTRDGFGPYEKDVVFSSIDTEKPGAAPFLEKFPIDVWPTLLFIDPTDERLVFKWLGSTDDAGMRALLDAARGTGPASEADALFAQGHAAEAAQRYAGTSLSSRSALSMLSALYLAHSYEACARATVDQLALFATPSDRVNALTWGLGCALKLPADDSHRARFVADLTKASHALLADRAKVATCLADDVSGLYEVLVDERADAHDEPGAQKQASAWLAFLDQHARSAKSPAARAVFDPHRVNAAIASKHAEKMVGPLLQSEKELPSDYNPPARLALVYRELGKLDEGLAAIDRALTRCTAGPRKLRLYDTRISLLEAKGDVAGVKQTLAEAVVYAKALPAAQRPQARVAALEERLAKLNATPSAH